MTNHDAPEPVPAARRTADYLTEQERAVLDLESRTWTRTASKERAIAEELGLSVTSYYQLLVYVVTKPCAAHHAPAVVRRIRTMTEKNGRAAARFLPS